MERTLVQDDREAGGYRYRDKNFNVLHTTSLPRSDEEAYAYFVTVNGWFRRDTPRYLERRALGGFDYQFIPVEYVEGRVEHFVNNNDNGAKES